MLSEPKPIRDYCLGIFDGPHATPAEADEGPYFLGIKNITEDGRLDFSDPRYVSEAEFPKWTRRVTPTAGDVVFTYEATLHRYALIPEDFRGCLGRRVALVRPDPTKADSRFLLYYFLSLAWRSVVESNIISGATVDRIPLERFPHFPVVLPELARQRAIAAVLAQYDDLIDNNRRRIALLDQSARVLYREWFVRLRFPGHEKTSAVDGVPEGWERGTVATYFDTAAGGTPSRANPDFFQGDINWVKTQELDDDFIFETEEKITEDALARSSAKLFPADTLLVSMYGGTNIGRTGILACPSASNQACCALTPRDQRAHFIYGALYFREERQYLIGLSQGAAQTNISQQVIRSLPMLMAPASLMAEFNSLLAPVFGQLRVLKQQVERLRTARDLLLPRLMSGELTV